MAGGVGLAALGLAGRLWPPARLSPAALAAAQPPLPAPQGGLRVYHLGHSLVGRDMPAMLAQLAPPGHVHASQLGWGASLRQHLGPLDAVPGHAVENAHPAHAPARPALASGAWDALVLTEMVELRDAIAHHDSPRALAEWARIARTARPDIRLYLYETWHRLDDPAGWFDRIAADLPGLWQGRLLAQAMARTGVGAIHLIPGGQALAAVARAADAGALPGLPDRRALFATGADGAPDPIHLNDIGAQVVALTHYATLYQRAPMGLPHRLLRADGTPAQAPDPATALAIQRLVWQAVRTAPGTGLSPGVLPG